MRPNSNVLVIDKECPRWLYEVLRRLGNQTAQQNHQLSAIERGEAPSGGGAPLISNNDHGELLGLYPDDDHLQYALLRGRVGGQTLNGSIDLSSSSSSFPWASAATTLITAGNNAGSITTWNRVINVNAPADNIIILSLASHSPGAGYGAGSTNYHTSITDSKGNTWQKLGEFTTAYFAGTEEQTNSLWLCLVTSAMTTAGSDSLTFNFGSSMGVVAVESHQFIGTSGLTFTVAGTSTGGNVDSLPPSLSLSGLTSREYLFIRGIAVHDTNAATNQVFTPTTSHTAFTSNHTDSTVPNGGANRGINARGEFIVLTGTGDTTNPTLNASGFPDDASLMVAVQIGSNVTGDLILESIDHSQAAKITLHNSTITTNADFLNFQAQGGSTTLSYIRGTDGAFVGPIVPTPNFALLNTTLFNDVVAQSPTRGSIIYSNSTPKWDELTVGTVGQYLGTDGTDILWRAQSTIDHGSLGGLADDDHAQYLLLAGRTNGQKIGTATQNGNSDDIVMSGRFNIGTSAFASGVRFLVQDSITNLTGTVNFTRITPSVGASGTSTATYRALLSQVTGGSSISAGAPSFIGATYQVTPQVTASGVTVIDVIGLDMSATVALGSGSSTVNSIMGLRGTARGGASNSGDTFVNTQIDGIKTLVSAGTGKTQIMNGLNIQMDQTNKSYNYTTRTVGINLDLFGDTGGTSWGSSNYTCTVAVGNPVLGNFTNVALIQIGQYVTGTNIPAASYVIGVNVGALTVTLNNNPTGNGTSVNVWGTTLYWSGIYRSFALPWPGEIVNARFFDLQADIPSQHYGYLYLRPPSVSAYPTPTAYLHIGAGSATANTAPIKLTSGPILTTAEAGAIEHYIDGFYVTPSTTTTQQQIATDRNVVCYDGDVVTADDELVLI